MSCCLLPPDLWPGRVAGRSSGACCEVWPAGREPPRPAAIRELGQGGGSPASWPALSVGRGFWTAWLVQRCQAAARRRTGRSSLRSGRGVAVALAPFATAAGPEAGSEPREARTSCFGGAEMAQPLRVDAPDARRATLLAQSLAHAETVELADGRWEVCVPLDREGRVTVPDVLAAARRWLGAEGLECTRIQIDGHAQMLRCGRSAAISSTAVYVSLLTHDQRGRRLLHARSCATPPAQARAMCSPAYCCVAFDFTPGFRARSAGITKCDA